MAACDANCRFTFVDVGSPGSEGDVNVFSRTDLGRNFLSESEEMDLPEAKDVNGTITPFYFVADDAFPISPRLLKPFGGRNLTNRQKIFNYRLSRARRTIENAFGILVMRWGCLRSQFLFHPDKVKRIVTACCVLHNYLINKHCPAYVNANSFDRVDNQNNIIDGEWRGEPQNSIDGMLLRQRGRPNELGSRIRERLADYFCYNYILDWQYERAHCNSDEE